MKNAANQDEDDNANLEKSDDSKLKTEFFSKSINNVSLTRISKKKEQHPTPLRRGKWTVEEEEYVAKVINAFNSGYLDAPSGTTLRSYLSEKLNCDPMRITKKFTGEACIGKRIFHPVLRCAENADVIDNEQAEVKFLEDRWRKRIEKIRETHKKNPVTPSLMAQPNDSHQSSNQSKLAYKNYFVGSARMERDRSNQISQITQVPDHVKYTASWLDRATDLLSTKTSPLSETDQNKAKIHMTEVEKLIKEAPMLSKGTPVTTPKSFQGTSETLSVTSASKIPIHDDISSIRQQFNVDNPRTDFEWGSFLKSSNESNTSDRQSFELDIKRSTHPKKRLKAFSTDHLNSMTHSDRKGTSNMQNVGLTAESNNRQNSTFPNTNIEDAENLIEFLQSVRRNHDSTSDKGSSPGIRKRSYSFA